MGWDDGDKADAAERGIVQRFGPYQATTQPGLRSHWPWPGAADVYARRYNLARDFYSFNRSMLACRQSIGGAGDVFVLEPDSDYFQFLKSELGAAAVSR
jgi:regulator of protease activity HflC (stomatin/prohibitin superfamily)